MSGKDIKVDEDVMAFIVESREILEEVEPQIVTLEQRLDRSLPADTETINLIFRAFHTIKGTAAFYQFDNVVGVTHKAETLLELFRKEGGEINTSCTELLCNTCDVIEQLFKRIEATGLDAGEDEDVKSVSSRLLGLTKLLAGRNDEPDDVDDTSTDELEAIDDEQGKENNEHRNNGRLFLSEGRPFFEEVQFEADKLLRLKKTENRIDQDILDKCVNNLKIIGETADFLAFGNILTVTKNLVDLLLGIEKNEYLASKSEIEVFVYGCGVINDLLLKIETEGDDKGYKDQIDTIFQAVSNPDSLTLGERLDNSDHSEPPENKDADVKSENESDVFKITPGMQSTFINESIEYIEDIEDVFLNLKTDVTDKEYLGEAFRLLHSFKGSCGFMNYGDLELLAHKTETLIEAALDGILILDDWDLKAIWFVIGVMRETLEKIAREDGGKILNIAVLVYMLEYIATFSSENEKDAEMLLPEIIKPRPLELEISKTELTKKQTGRPLKRVVIDQETIDSLLQTDEKERAGHMKKQNNSEKKESPSGNNGALKMQQVTPKTLERRDIRVSLDKLDELINLIGELVIAENMVIRNPDVVNREMESFDKASLHLSKIVRDLQDVALSVRMIPISGVFRKMIRLVHDLSVKSKKKVGLQLIGEDTEIDKTVAELIADPLVHLVRNAIDHGIQKKDKKDNAQNDGNVILEARHEGGEVWILIKDDGDGLDIPKILQKGIDSGLVSGDGHHLNDQEIIELIFQPGFSTSEMVTAVSGRGVGMDVVKKNIEKIKGHIDVYSRPGQGTTFIMRIPLTLAIIDGMLVRVGEASYTIPLLSIRESIQVEEQNVTVTMDGQEMVKVRDELIPVIRLHNLYKLRSDYDKLHEGLLVIIEHQRETACLFIDEIIGEQQTVIKGLTGYMEGIKGVSGCTILGDGEVSLILDVAGLIRRTYSDEVTFHEPPL